MKKKPKTVIAEVWHPLPKLTARQHKAIVAYLKRKYKVSKSR